jgi:Trypsin-like peptidase domain
MKLLATMFIFICAFSFAQEPAKFVLPQTPEVRIHAHNAQGSQLRDGLGFLWDDHTVVTSYSAVQGASWIKVEVEGENVVAGELVSFSKLFDIAFLRTAEELPEGRLFGSSDTLAAGDSAFLFAQDKGTWKLKETHLKKWEDSGQGFVWLHFPEMNSGSASPLFNKTGKIVGWFPGKSPAIPLKAIFAQMADRSAPISLPEFTTWEKFWNVLKVPAKATDKKEAELLPLKKISGPHFEIGIPRNWEHQTSQQKNHYLLLAASRQSGISLAIRVVPAETGDLNLETERAELLLFPGTPRKDMDPAMVGGISGLEAHYEDAQGFASTSFYGLSSGRLCILTVTYPSTMKVNALLDKLYASVNFPSAVK